MKSFIIPATVSVVFLSGCVIVHTDGDGDADSTRNVEVGDFAELVVEGRFDRIDLEVCDCEPGLQLVGTADEVDNARVDIDGVRLELDTDGFGGIGRTQLSATIKTRSLDAVTVTSSADVTAIGIDSERFSVFNTGSAEITLSGKADALDIVSSGSGDTRAFALHAGDVEVLVSGSGNAEVCAHETLTGNLTGSGDVIYDCGPAVKDLNVTGSGKTSIR